MDDLGRQHRKHKTRATEDSLTRLILRNSSGMSMSQDFVPCSSRKSSNELTLEHRLEVLDRLGQGESGSTLAKKFNVDKSTISRIKRNHKALLERKYNNEPLSRFRALDTNGATYKIDLAVLEYLEELKQKGLAEELTGKMLQDRAREVWQQLRRSLFSCIGVSAEVKDFTASDGWLRGFKRRHGETLKAFGRNSLRCLNSDIKKGSAGNNHNDSNEDEGNQLIFSRNSSFLKDERSGLALHKMPVKKRPLAPGWDGNHFFAENHFTPKKRSCGDNSSILSTSSLWNCSNDDDDDPISESHGQGRCSCSNVSSSALFEAMLAQSRYNWTEEDSSCSFVPSTGCDSNYSSDWGETSRESDDSSQ